MSTKQKLKTLTLCEKFDVINVVKSGMKKKDVAVQYELPASTLLTIIKNEAEILLRCESSSNLSCKRQRTAKFPDLEECLLAWHLSRIIIHYDSTTRKTYLEIMPL